MTTSLVEYYEALSRHDWFTCFSDDPSEYRRGEAADATLEKIAIENGPVYLWLYKSFGKNAASGKSWGTPVHPKPPSPLDRSLEQLIDLRANYEQLQLDVLALAALHIVGCIEHLGNNGQSQMTALTDRAMREKAVLSQAFYMGAYAGNEPMPALVKNSAELSWSWAKGSAEVAEYAALERERITRAKSVRNSLRIG